MRKPSHKSCLKEFIKFLYECKVILLNGNLQSVKRHHMTKNQIKVWWSSLKNNRLIAKERRFGIRKKVKTHESYYYFRFWSFVLIWSGLFSSMLLCTTPTRFSILKTLENECSQGNKLNKITRTNFILVERILSCNCIKFRIRRF